MFVYKFWDNKDRYWKVYYDEISSPKPAFFSKSMGNWYPSEDGDYEATDCEVEIKSLSGKTKRILNLTIREAEKYIENRIYNPEIEED